MGLLLTSTGLAVLAQGGPAEKGFSPQTRERLQQVLTSFVSNPDNSYVGGMAVAIKIDDLAFWQGAAGLAARDVDAQNSLLPGDTPDEFGNLPGYGLKELKQISGDYDFIGHNGSVPGYRSFMAYHPDMKLTIVVLTNFAGVSPYDIAKALFEALPDFTCGNDNRTEDKIRLCHKGQEQYVARSAAPGFIEKEAYLGGCELDRVQEAGKETDETGGFTYLRAYPNPVADRSVLSFRTGHTGMASLRLYDVSGHMVTTLFKGVVEKGVEQQVVLERTTLPAGVYFGRLQTPTGITQKKLVLSH
jgi:hypothetical protein